MRVFIDIWSAFTKMYLSVTDNEKRQNKMANVGKIPPEIYFPD